MALQCQLSFNAASCTAGCSPPPQLYLSVYNPNAVAVTVTGVQVYTRDISGNMTRAPAGNVSFPVGPGQPTTIAALGTQILGPVAFAVSSAANASSFQNVAQVSGSATPNDQLSQSPQSIVVAAATVLGSDGSSNEAGTAGLLVSYTQVPAAGSQGGFLAYFNGTNFLTGLTLGVL